MDLSWAFLLVNLQSLIKVKNHPREYQFILLVAQHSLAIPIWNMLLGILIENGSLILINVCVYINICVLICVYSVKL